MELIFSFCSLCIDKMEKKTKEPTKTKPPNYQFLYSCDQIGCARATRLRADTMLGGDQIWVLTVQLMKSSITDGKGF